MILNFSKEILSMPLPGEKIHILKKNVSNPIIGKLIHISVDSFLLSICSRSVIEIKFAQTEKILRGDTCQ